MEKNKINKKGFMTQAIIMLVLIAVLIGIMVVYYIWGMVAPHFTSLSNEMLNEIIIATGNDTVNNLSQASASSFEPLRQSLGMLSWLSVLFFFVLILGFIMIMAMIRTYPWLIIIWIVGILLLAFTSLILTNSYEDIYAGDSYSREVYSQWSGNHFLLTNMPIIIVAVGTLGGLVMLLMINRDPDIEISGGSGL